MEQSAPAMESKVDMVNHPPHYTRGKIEVIDFIEDQQFDFHIGTAIRYLCRAGYKWNAVEDLEKAIWYINRKIQKLKEQEHSTYLIANQLE